MNSRESCFFLGGGGGGMKQILVCQKFHKNFLNNQNISTGKDESSNNIANASFLCFSFIIVCAQFISHSMSGYFVIFL